MPELPEVETVCKGIAPHLEGALIEQAKVYDPKLRIKMPSGLAKKITGTKIHKVERKAKYILLYLDNDLILIIHLGMSGRLNILTEKDAKKKHDHLLLVLDSGKHLVFNDTRKFGLVTLCDITELGRHKLFTKLGLEPLSKDFNAEVFYQILQSRNKSIKAVIMDSNIIVGIGNIYACEALFTAGIHPEKISSEISKKKSQQLYKSIVDTLTRAIKAGGSTISDYAKADGSSGYFQHEFFVYGREAEPCKNCKSKIERIKQNGRSSFYCKKCQS